MEGKKKVTVVGCLQGNVVLYFPKDHTRSVSDM